MGRILPPKEHRNSYNFSHNILRFLFPHHHKTSEKGRFLIDAVITLLIQPDFYLSAIISTRFAATFWHSWSPLPILHKLCIYIYKKRQNYCHFRQILPIICFWHTYKIPRIFQYHYLHVGQSASFPESWCRLSSGISLTAFAVAIDQDQSLFRRLHNLLLFVHL